MPYLKKTSKEIFIRYPEYRIPISAEFYARNNYYDKCCKTSERTTDNGAKIRYIKMLFNLVLKKNPSAFWAYKHIIAST